MILTHGANSLSRGGGSKGIVFDVDFKNYSKPSYSWPYMYPNVGAPVFVGKSSDGNIALTANGLSIAGSVSNQLVQPILFDYSESDKIRIYQKIVGVISRSQWSEVGFLYSGYTDTSSSSRGMGAIVSSTLTSLNTAAFKNGHSADWGFTSSLDPGSCMLIVPQQRLYPIEGLTLETEIIFDPSINKISYSINGVDALEVTDVPNDIFYTELTQCTKYHVGSGGDSVNLERCTIEII